MAWSPDESAVNEPRPLVVQIGYSAPPPALTAAAVLDAVRGGLPDAELITPGSPQILLLHPGHEVTLADGARVGLVTSVSRLDGGGGFVEDIEVSQSWSVPDAPATLAACRAALSVIEVFGRLLPADIRLPVHAATVLAVCGLTSPVAVWWSTSEQLRFPPLAGDPPLDAALNVRVFRVDGEDVVIDTLGLHAFGLPDVQCHCHGLPVDRLAGLLRGAAEYLFANGDVLRDGDTVEGLHPGDAWTCRHEPALVAPARIVVDLDPGSAYAAGRRV